MYCGGVGTLSGRIIEHFWLLLLPHTTAFLLVQAILSAAVRPQSAADSGLTAALSMRGSTVVPIDELGCQPAGAVDTASAAGNGASGNPAVQALEVRVCGCRCNKSEKE